MILQLVDEAVRSGARQSKACEVLAFPPRTLQRWREQGPDGGEDRRRGSNSAPKNKLSEEERQNVLDVMNSEEMRNLSPRQIVPRLADRGEYVASESTMYRVLEEEGQNNRRGHAKAPANKKPPQLVATGPEQVLCWDITYLPAAIRGAFFYLYLFLDVWSRKILAWEVHEREDDELSAKLLAELCADLEVPPQDVHLHSDNGGPMKGNTMLAMIQSLGIMPSFSRPGVSDDNPFVESLFRTLKYHPSFPELRFDDIAAARSWVEAFVAWYNFEHRHSLIGFVTPHQRHVGDDIQILEQRRDVYAAARAANPLRWTGNTRAWDRPETVALNPDRPSVVLPSKRAIAV